MMALTLSWATLLLLSACLLMPAHAVVVPSNFTARLDRFITCVLAAERLSPPSLTVSVVAGENTVYARGFGFRDANLSIPTDEKTLFGIGSVSKAFTSSLIAITAERSFPQQQASDSPSDLPQRLDELFRLPLSLITDADGDNLVYSFAVPFIEAHASLQDLLGHRTGIQRADLRWILNTNYSTSSIIDWHDALYVIPRLESTVSFREQFVYNNYAYAEAAELFEQLYIQGWATAMNKTIFSELGMKSTTTTHRAARLSTDNVAALWVLNPYSQTGLPLVNVPLILDDIIDVVAPAGAINSNAVDMAEWIKAQLGHRPTTLSSSVLQQTRQIRMNVGDESADVYLNTTQTLLSGAVEGYGMGWFKENINGHLIYTHSGGTLGALTLLHIFPQDDFGIFVSSPAVNLQVHSLIMLWVDLELLSSNNFVDQLCKSSGFPDAQQHAFDQSSEFAPLKAMIYQEVARVEKRHHLTESFAALYPISEYVEAMSSSSSHVQAHSWAATDPSVFVGSYKHPAWGLIVVSASGNVDAEPLSIVFGMMTAALSLSAIQPPPASGVVAFDVRTTNQDGLQFIIAGGQNLIGFVLAADSKSATDVILGVDTPMPVFVNTAITPASPSSSSSSTGGPAPTPIISDSNDATFSTTSIAIIVILLISLASSLIFSAMMYKRMKSGTNNSDIDSQALRSSLL